MRYLIRLSLITLLIMLAGCSGTDEVEELVVEDVINGLIVDYKFSGNTFDSGINKLNAEQIGGKYVEDRFGKDNSAFYFDGIDDFIELPNSPLLKPNLPISISFWINYSSEDYKDRDLFNTSFEENRSSGIWFNSQSTTGKYSVSFGNYSGTYASSSRRTFTSNQVIDINNWHHIMIILESTENMKIIIDNVEYEGEYSGEGKTLEYSAAPGNIGRHDRHSSLPANYFKGKIDDFRMWNRALTIDEVDRVYEIQNSK